MPLSDTACKNAKALMGILAEPDKLLATIPVKELWGFIRYASQGLSARWQMRQQLKSPAYTTRWECLPVATIC
jgi:Domain of unknown function (DUF4113)